MQDVAVRAGVSHQTVSRFVNDSGAVKAATGDRIASAIGQLGYRGNLAARTLATRRSRAIGVLAPEADDFGPTSTIHALEFAARERGYRLIVMTCLDAAGSLEQSLSLLLQQAVEAIVVVAPSERTAAVMAGFGDCPVLSLQKGPQPAARSVYIDQAAGVAMAVGHLIERGHRRIQMVLGPAHSVEAAQRRDAFDRLVHAAGLPAGRPIPGDWTARSGFAGAAAVDPATTAVFCANDQMALGLISGLHERGLRVPGDVSIVGFDDVPEAAYFAPPLTTVRQDFRRVGELAIDRLDRLLNGGAPRTRVVRPALVVRGSVGDGPGVQAPGAARASRCPPGRRRRRPRGTSRSAPCRRPSIRAPGSPVRGSAASGAAWRCRWMPGPARCAGCGGRRGRVRVARARSLRGG
jgi:DNA-binding LacI/PurR family transcriptional regulator